MPGSRCVVQGCSNRSQPSLGISLHSSPVVKRTRNAWVRFVRTHRANFNPEGRFVVCSEHFEPHCLEKTLHVEGFRRFLISGSIPTIWKKGTAQPASSSARKVRAQRKVRISRRLSCHIFCTLWLFNSRSITLKYYRLSVFDFSNIYI